MAEGIVRAGLSDFLGNLHGSAVPEPAAELKVPGTLHVRMPLPTASPEFKVPEARAARTVASMLAGFEASCLGERADQPLEAWGGKVGLSVYDEEAILSVPARAGANAAVAAASEGRQTPCPEAAGLLRA